MLTLAARRYISPRTRPLSLQEQETRRLAYLPSNVSSNASTRRAASSQEGSPA